MIKEKVKNTIIKNSLISPGDRVLVGLSGGADSVCLTHVLCSLQEELGIQIAAAHLNHNIRGEEAVRDEEFSENFSNTLKIPFFKKSVKVRDIARDKGISEEAAGRDERYLFFAEIAKEYGFNKIATAHNKNDTAETIAMNFMRGSALSGLSGIPYKRNNIIRPLLDISRREIEEYCKIHGLSFVTDRTNQEDNYTRNKIRHKLIPLIESEFNANFINTASRNALLIKCEDEYMMAAARDKYNEYVKDNSIEINNFLSCHIAIARRILREMIDNVCGIGDISSEFSDKIMELAKRNKSGSYINLPKNASARIEYGRLVIEKKVENEEYEYSILLNTDIYIKEAGINLRVELTSERKNDGAQYFSNIDIDNLKVRSRRNGDFFYPCGMSGKKKLKDYFIDEKIARHIRNTVPIITSGEDIIYIAGYRRDRRFAFNGTGIKLIIS